MESEDGGRALSSVRWYRRGYQPATQAVIRTPTRRTSPVPTQQRRCRRVESSPSRRQRGRLRGTPLSVDAATAPKTRLRQHPTACLPLSWRFLVWEMFTLRHSAACPGRTKPHRAFDLVLPRVTRDACLCESIAICCAARCAFRSCCRDRRITPHDFAAGCLGQVIPKADGP